MYDDSDLDSAVRAKALPADAAEQLRSHSAKRSGGPLADQERVKLISGQTDIYVSIGIVLMFYGLLQVLWQIGHLTGLIFAGASWALTEYFWKRRGMMLPGILLLGIFIAGSVSWLFAISLELPGPAIGDGHAPGIAELVTPLRGLFISAGAIGAGVLFWSRFYISFVWFVVALAGLSFTSFLEMMLFADPSTVRANVIILIYALGQFLVAIWLDMSDIFRQTRRSDIAFWLHLFSGFAIANVTLYLAVGLDPSAGVPYPLFRSTLLNLDVGQAVLVLSLFILFGVVGLLINRRALMMSSLLFTLMAFGVLLGEGQGSLPIAGAFALGTIILVTGAFWTPLRRLLLAGLPPLLVAQLPRTDIGKPRPRPVT